MGHPDFITSFMHFDLGTGEVCGLVVFFVWTIVHTSRELRNILKREKPAQQPGTFVRLSTSFHLEFRLQERKD
jgi:hypothetical protein